MITNWCTSHSILVDSRVVDLNVHRIYLMLVQSFHIEAFFTFSIFFFSEMDDNEVSNDSAETTKKDSEVTFNPAVMNM